MSHAPLRNDADPQWRAMHRAAEQHEAALARLLVIAFGALRARVILLRIRSALRFGNVEQALQAVPVLDLLLLRSAVEAAIREAAMAGAAVGLEGSLIVRLATNEGLVSRDLLFWARQRAAGLVTGITEQTRQALRETILEAVQSGMSPARLAKRVETVIGLNRLQARALAKRAEELRAAGVTGTALERRLASYANRLRRQRARVIARHELMRAANEGRRAVWSRNVSDGLIVPDRWHREWVAIVPSDGRTCRTCVGLDGQHAPINGAYPNGLSGPPAHVLCRCTEKLVRAGA